MSQTCGFSLPHEIRFAGFSWGPRVHRAGFEMNSNLGLLLSLGVQ